MKKTVLAMIFLVSMFHSILFAQNVFKLLSPQGGETFKQGDTMHICALFDTTLIKASGATEWFIIDFSFIDVPEEITLAHIHDIYGQRPIQFNPFAQGVSAAIKVRDSLNGTFVLSCTFVIPDSLKLEHGGVMVSTLFSPANIIITEASQRIPRAQTTRPIIIVEQTSGTHNGYVPQNRNPHAICMHEQTTRYNLRGQLAPQRQSTASGCTVVKSSHTVSKQIHSGQRMAHENRSLAGESSAQ